MQFITFLEKREKSFQLNNFKDKDKEWKQARKVRKFFLIKNFQFYQIHHWPVALLLLFWDYVRSIHNTCGNKLTKCSSVSALSFISFHNLDVSFKIQFKSSGSENKTKQNKAKRTSKQTVWIWKEKIFLFEKNFWLIYLYPSIPLQIDNRSISSW